MGQRHLRALPAERLTGDGMGQGQVGCAVGPAGLQGAALLCHSLYFHLTNGGSGGEILLFGMHLSL